MAEEKRIFHKLFCNMQMVLELQCSFGNLGDFLELLMLINASLP